MTGLRFTDVILNAGAPFTLLLPWSRSCPWRDWELRYMNHFSEAELVAEVPAQLRLLFKLLYRTQLDRICREHDSCGIATVRSANGAWVELRESTSTHVVSDAARVADDPTANAMDNTDQAAHSVVEAALYYENKDHHGDFSELFDQVCSLPDCKRVVILSELEVEQSCYIASKLTNSLIRLLQIPHVEVVDISRNSHLAKVVGAVFPELLKLDADNICKKLVWFNGPDLSHELVTATMGDNISLELTTENATLHKSYHEGNSRQRPFRCVWTNCV